MEIERKYTAIRVETYPDKHDNKWLAELDFGNIEYSYSRRESPNTLFDTETDAEEYAYKTDKYAKWLILPIITFNIF